MTEETKNQLCKIVKGQLELGKSKDELINSLSGKEFQVNDIIEVYNLCIIESQNKKNKAALAFLILGVVLLVVSLTTWGISIGNSYYEERYYWWGGLLGGLFFSIVGLLKFRKK